MKNSRLRVYGKTEELVKNVVECVFRMIFSLLIPKKADFLRRTFAGHETIFRQLMLTNEDSRRAEGGTNYPPQPTNTIVYSNNRHFQKRADNMTNKWN